MGACGVGAERVQSLRLRMRAIILNTLLCFICLPLASGASSTPSSVNQRSRRLNKNHFSSHLNHVPLSRLGHRKVQYPADAVGDDRRASSPVHRSLNVKAGVVVYPPNVESLKKGEEIEEELSSNEVFTKRFEVGGSTVVVRPVRKSDAQSIFTAINTNRDHLERWIPQMRGSFTNLREVGYNVDYWIWKMQTARGLVMAVEVNGSVEGIMAINIIDWKNKCGYLGYWLTKNIQGKGIATRGMNHVIRVAMEELHLDHLDISTMKENSRSKALASRLGFEAQPSIADLDTQYLWGILPVRQIQLDVLTRSKETADASISEARIPYFWFNLRKHIQENTDPIGLEIQSRQLYEPPKVMEYY